MNAVSNKGLFFRFLSACGSDLTCLHLACCQFINNETVKTIVKNCCNLTGTCTRFNEWKANMPQMWYCTGSIWYRAISDLKLELTLVELLWKSLPTESVLHTESLLQTSFSFCCYYILLQPNFIVRTPTKPLSKADKNLVLFQSLTCTAIRLLISVDSLTWRDLRTWSVSTCTGRASMCTRSCPSSGNKTLWTDRNVCALLFNNGIFWQNGYIRFVEKGLFDLMWNILSRRSCPKLTHLNIGACNIVNNFDDVAAELSRNCRCVRHGLHFL